MHMSLLFTRGFAYLPGRKYDNGLLAGKLAMVSVTTGTERLTDEQRRKMFLKLDTFDRDGDLVAAWITK